MTNEIKNVPELRFPEFKEEWVEKKLGEITSKISDGIHSTPTYDSNGDIYFINGNNLVNGRIDFKTSKKISVQEFNKYKNYLEAKNTLLLSINGTIGNIAKYEGENILLGKSAAYINVVSKFISRCYIFYYLQTSKIYESFLRELTGTTIKNLSLKSIKNIIVYISELDEQQKIGEFFSKLDRQIELEEQKLEKLEEQKKGYMQNIFLQQLRFKDENGNDYPEWRKIELGNLGTTFTGLSGKTKEDFGHGNAKFITYMNVFKNTIAELEMTKKVDVKDNERQSKVEYKDILFTTSSETPNEAGMSSIWLYKSENMYLNSFCFGFKVNYKDIEPIYLTRYLRSENMRKKITVLSQGSTRFNISKREMMKLTINFPVIEEQTKIVKFLDIAERRIGEQNKKLEQLKQRKKGFLQKMFV